MPVPPASAARDNGVSASFSETGAGGTQISAKVPAGASTGAIKVTAGSSSYVTSSNFTVFATAAPWSAVSFRPAACAARA